jgi:hypothetical protein
MAINQEVVVDAVEASIMSGAALKHPTSSRALRAWPSNCRRARSLRYLRLEARIGLSLTSKLLGYLKLALLRCECAFAEL